MTLKNIYRETVAALSSNLSRSFLTVLGIVIGIGSVIVMLAVGTGASNSIQSNIQGLGANLLSVSPGRQRGPNSQVTLGRGSATSLTLDDAEAITSDVQGVEYVAPVVRSQSQVIAKGSNTNTSIVGTTAGYASVRTVDIAEGTFITDKHVSGVARVAVIGPVTRDDLFGVGTEAIGQSIRIKGIDFDVVGVTTSKGGGSGFGNPDDTIYIPLSVAQQMITGNKYLSSIDMQVTDQSQMQTVKNQVTQILVKQHRLADPTSPDFSFLDQASISATVSSITGIMTALLGSIAGISLIVGGIGIMNMMLTSVTERTREIGLRKAVGAKRSDISTQFLAEAVALTVIGGVVGIMLGYVLSALISFTGVLETQITMRSILMAVGVAALTGIVFGYIPARKAASLNPIDALRYE